jgi:putative transposase
LTDGQGIPLSVVITAASTHDMKAAIHTLDNIVVKRRSSKRYKEKQNGVINKGYLPHIRHRGEQSVIKIKDGDHHHTKRRWVVERTNSWHNRLRKLLVRYEKKLENNFALVCLGCCIVIYRWI